MTKPPTILCIASFFKGNEFIREAARLGARVLLVTREKLLVEDWARESLVDLLAIRGRPSARRYRHVALQLARRHEIDRVVALEELDVMTAGHIREELGLPGMSYSAARAFQDKLSMRRVAHDAGVLVPAFVPVLNGAAIETFLGRVPPPWMLKPRVGASSMGMRKLRTADDVWSALRELDERHGPDPRTERHLIEQYVPGDVYHVDSLVTSGRCVFSSVERYGNPPFEIASGGGVATSRTVLRGSPDEQQLLAINARLLELFAFDSGVTHIEFIRGAADGRFYFLECAARVGGAYTATTVEAATGVNLWTEWAKIECASLARPYSDPVPRAEYAGIAVSLARQEHPDTSAYVDPEIVFRVQVPQHVGLVVRSSSHERVVELLDDYAERFAYDFTASAPLEDTPLQHL